MQKPEEILCRVQKTNIWLLIYRIFMSLSSMGEVRVHCWLVVGAVLCLTLHFFLHTLFWFWALVMPVYITLLSCHSSTISVCLH